jgi:hypothetical protein
MSIPLGAIQDRRRFGDNGAEILEFGERVDWSSYSYYFASFPFFLPSTHAAFFSSTLPNLPSRCCISSRMIYARYLQSLSRFIRKLLYTLTQKEGEAAKDRKESEIAKGLSRGMKTV